MNGEGSFLFCYVLGKEFVWFKPMGAVAPDPSGVGSVPRLTTSLVELCGADYRRGHQLA